MVTIPNAIARATGARVYQLPATPERVWRAMRASRHAAGAPGEVVL